MNVDIIRNMADFKSLVESDQQLLQDFDRVSQSCLGDLGMGGGQASYAKDARMASIIDHRDEVRQRLVDDYESYVHAVQRGFDELLEVEDCGIRSILILRFVRGYRWDEVARQIGGNVTADSVKKRVERYITAKNQAGTSIKSQTAEKK